MLCARWNVRRGKEAWSHRDCVRGVLDEQSQYDDMVGKKLVHRSSCGNWAIRHTQKIKNTQNTPAVHEEASESKWSCHAHVRWNSPPPPYSLALRGMYGSSGMDERSVGGKSSPVVVSLNLFGEFADDADQCSIFIFKTLVVCSQVYQNLQVEVKAHKSNMNRRHLFSKSV